MGIIKQDFILTEHTYYECEIYFYRQSDKYKSWIDVAKSCNYISAEQLRKDFLRDRILRYQLKDEEDYGI